MATPHPSSGPASGEAPASSDWSASVIWWHVYPLGFVDAERHAVTEVSHRLPKLLNWLDYVIELGANGLLLAPIFAAGSHGYDTLDHYRIDPRLGDDGDFDALVTQCRARGIRICLDGVFNHLSRDHEIVRRAIASGPDTPEGAWIKWSAEGYPWNFEGHPRLVELNLANPVVAQYIGDVMIHWLDRGADAWRLDAAYSAGAAAWRPIIDRVRAAHPEVWILGEVLHGPFEEFVGEAGIDSITQYELWHLTWTALKDRNFFALDWALQHHREFVKLFRPQTFLSNHDVTRIATHLDDPRHNRLAVALLMLLPGVPSIYAGDEQGFTGEKQENAYGDDAVRPPFPDSPDGLLPFGADLHDHYRAMIALRRQHPWLVDAEVTTSAVTNTSITIHLAGPEHRLDLRLNISDEPVDGVPPHSWQLS